MQPDEIIQILVMPGAEQQTWRVQYGFFGHYTLSSATDGVTQANGSMPAELSLINPIALIATIDPPSL
ncbi:hypothetical protein HNQ96_002363 [Aminobacter lissarensis]|uniref:Uncharacterized protein n=1 Tax=Aminobacter carboxidus TaxID=376165 RepID=A0A8E1WEF8_9HYPH|nr:hypothetical protein [Aminobacter lissarensis]